MNILVVAAHPDDEVLGCGGTIARLKNEGHVITVLILGEGITSRPGLNSERQKELMTQLHAQAHNAGALLGVEKVILQNFPDNRFDSVDLLDIVHAIESVIDEFQPEVVYTQHGGDLNIDHQITFKATMTAVRPMKGSVVKALYSYEVASSTEWAFQQFSPAFNPSRFVDITNTLELKVKALQIYEGEEREFPHPRSAEALIAQNKRNGSVVGFGAAEAFSVIFEKI